MVGLTTLGLAAGSWVLAVRQMTGMDMGDVTRLGSVASFLAQWVTMVLRGAVPAVAQHAHANARARSPLAFVGAYLGVWTLVGLAVYALYRPHGSVAAGVVAIVTGVYVLTLLKRRCRRGCREGVRSGLEFGLYCVGSSVGLMAMLVAVGLMSIAWMLVIAARVIAERFLPAKAAIDVPVALAIIGFGLLIVLVPSAVPGRGRSM